MNHQTNCSRRSDRG